MIENVYLLTFKILNIIFHFIFSRKFNIPTFNYKFVIYFNYYFESFIGLQVLNYQIK